MCVCLRGHVCASLSLRALLWEYLNKHLRTLIHTHAHVPYSYSILSFMYQYICK